ncbi:MAG: hypothetical protein R3E98_17970 [Gemmatimonadota bacterium]|nr:hypothetical protein [Gemmatimonadota bacterium]
MAEQSVERVKTERCKRRNDPRRHIALAVFADGIDTLDNRARRHSVSGGVSAEQLEVSHQTA